MKMHTEEPHHSRSESRTFDEFVVPIGYSYIIGTARFNMRLLVVGVSD